MVEAPRRIAVVGIGQMGSRYARRLVAAGASVSVWNRSAERSAPLAAIGAKVAPSLAEAITESDIVISALENAPAMEATLLAPEALARLRPEQLVIDTSTVHPDAARKACAALAARSAAYVDSPVSGGTRGASEGTLTLFVGGSSEHFERARPVLEILGTPHHLGPVGSGQAAKLANQVIVAATIGAVAEGLFLAERYGLDGAKLLTALRGGFADGRIMREHGQRMVQRDFAPGAANRVFMKDLKAIEALAADLATALPLTTLARGAYAQLIATGHGEDDHASYFTYLDAINRART